MTPPLLLLEAARIDVGGAPLCDGLGAVSEADRVGLVGDWSALFALLSARARLVRGRAEVAGVPAGRAVASGQVGLALSDVALPGATRVLDYLAASARLAGFPSRRAPDASRRALGELGLEALAGRRIRDLGPLERRGLGIVHAVLGHPGAIVLDAPLGGLDVASSGIVAGWVERAATGRRLLVSAKHTGIPGPERGFFDGLGEILVLGPGGLLAQGPPAETLGDSDRYLLVVRRRGTELQAALRAHGIEATLESRDDTCVRLLLELRAPGALDLVRDAVVELEVPLIELTPLASPPDRVE
jgi:ABC-type multidrug transport system ATPase subunit